AEPPEPQTDIQTEPDEAVPTEDYNASPSLADHALRAALFGLLLWPIIIGIFTQVYSLWLLGKLATRDEEMDSSYSWKLSLALALDPLGLVLGALYVIAIVNWMRGVFS